MDRRHHITWILTILLVAVSLACNAIPGDPTPTVTPEPVPTATLEPTSPTPPSSGPTKAPPTPDTSEVETTDASLEIINASGVDITEVYISPSDAEDWGDNQLTADVVEDLTSYTIAGIQPGVYDVQAVDVDGYAIETAWELEITGVTSWEVAGGALVEIINETDEEIWYVYISPSESDTWGDDVLGDDTIPVDGSFVVEDLDRGLYDMRVENAEGDHVETQYRVDLRDEHYWFVTGVVSLPDNAELRFEDDFTDNRNDWGGTSNAEAVYNAPTDGEYCVEIIAENLTAWEWYEPFRTDDFIAEVSCAPEVEASATCGLGFGPDGDNLYWAEFSPTHQQYAVFVLQDDEWVDPLQDWTTSYSIHPEGWNYISIERIDGVLTLYINGIVQAELDGSRFPTGRIGLGGATYEEGNQRVCLDDLRVWQVE